MKKPYIIGICISAFLFGAPAMGQSVNLFEELDPAQSAFSQNDQGVLHRHVKINKNLVKAIFKNDGEDPALTLALDLEPGETAIFRTTDREAQMAPQTRLWSGRASGPVDGSATLLFRRGGIVGHLQIGPKAYRITPQPDGVHMITVIDLQTLPSEGSDMAHEDEGDDMMIETED